ncbi:hypothetical protein CERSUDRAFT_114965 [Gelatoporia subvermispora B]|uniref:Yeast cell wall synthesis Kre9/Knh1-like N-terminal domain-containing protein n=1 Tax=Ceriporiopsis subvermispora (strain B) TaxID=914234 RepID=M2PL81_CERS8|nr:hypothetical protein CERSUDRAFT_114965 [Gelatoporia subvermispora B]
MIAPAFLLLAAFAQSAFATIYITSPVATTSWAAGQQQNVNWQDDGTSPSLSAFGPASVGIYIGTVNQQTLVQEIVSNVDVSTTSSIAFTPDQTMGSNGDMYFIRFQSLSATDSTTGYPLEAFSSKFTLTGMTGQFNATEEAEINASSGAPAASSPAPTSAPASSSSAGPSKAFSSSDSSKVVSSSAAAASQTANGAASLAVNGLAGIAVAALSAFLL